MYEAEVDPYCYPGTAVLINRAGLRDQAALEAFEAEWSHSDSASPFHEVV